MTLLSAGHEMEVVARAEGDKKGVSFDQLAKLFVIGVQQTDTEEALGAMLDNHISKLEGAQEGKVEADKEPGAQI